MNLKYLSIIRLLSISTIFILIAAVPLTAQSGMDYLRTHDSRFNNLPGYDFEPHYAYVDDYEGGKLRMHYADEGPKGAPAVIMVHGNPTWSYQFRDLVPILNKAGYRTILIDLIGMGRSDKPTDFDDYTYDRHVGWVSQLITHIDTALGLSRITYFGHDYGTPIGIRLMNEHFPERFDAFIDANASLPDGTFISPVHINWRQFVRDNPDVPVGHVISGQVEPPLSAREVYAYYAPFPDSSYKTAVRSFPEMVPESRDEPEAVANISAWEFLETFKRPFMTIFGKADSKIFSARRDFIDRVPGAYGQPHPQLDVTHYAPEDKPEEVAAEVLKFLDDVYHPVSFKELMFSDFEEGLDGFVLQGENCIYDQERKAIKIQCSGGETSSAFLDPPIDLRGSDAVKVSFRYLTSGMNADDEFYVEIWEGSKWTNILTLTSEDDFADGVKDYGFIRIDSAGVIFASESRIRFRCSLGNNSGTLYILDFALYIRKKGVSEVDDLSVSLSENNISPNPASEYIEVRQPSEGFEPSEGSAIKIYNAFGECVVSVRAIHELPLHRIDISHLPIGIYFIQIGNYSEKFVVVR